MVDLPGYGRSAGIEAGMSDTAVADWVLSYLEDRALRRVHLIGHSLGGYVGLAFARTYPEHSRSLTLLDAGHLRLPRIARQFGAVGYAPPVLSLAARLLGPRRLTVLLERINDPEEPATERATTVTDNARTAPLNERVTRCKEKGYYHLDDDRNLREALCSEPEVDSGGLALLFAFYRARPPALLAQVEVPTSLVWSDDPTRAHLVQRRARRAAQRLVAINPSLEELRVRGGHYVHWIDPRVVERAVEHIRAADADGSSASGLHAPCNPS